MNSDNQRFKAEKRKPEGRGEFFSEKKPEKTTYPSNATVDQFEPKKDTLLHAIKKIMVDANIDQYGIKNDDGSDITIASTNSGDVRYWEYKKDDERLSQTAFKRIISADDADKFRIYLTAEINDRTGIGEPSSFQSTPEDISFSKDDVKTQNILQSTYDEKISDELGHLAELLNSYCIVDTLYRGVVFASEEEGKEIIFDFYGNVLMNGSIAGEGNELLGYDMKRYGKEMEVIQSSIRNYFGDYYLLKVALSGDEKLLQAFLANMDVEEIKAFKNELRTMDWVISNWDVKENINAAQTCASVEMMRADREGGDGPVVYDLDDCNDNR